MVDLIYHFGIEFKEEIYSRFCLDGEKMETEMKNATVMLIMQPSPRLLSRNYLSRNLGKTLQPAQLLI